MVNIYAIILTKFLQEIMCIPDKIITIFALRIHMGENLMMGRENPTPFICTLNLVYGMENPGAISGRGSWEMGTTSKSLA